MRLKGKVILVTGSTSGIGEGMVRRFAQEGARVVVHGLAQADADRVAAGIRRRKGRAFAVAGDLADPAVPARLIAQVIARYGRIDGLVNNAAIMTRGSLEATTLAKFDTTIAVNLRAPYLLVHAALPHFRRQKGGRVLNIGSVNAYAGERNQFAYSVSKGGLMTLTRNIADAYAVEGVRVNQFNVGWTLTTNERKLKIKEGLSRNWPRHVSPEFAPSGRLLYPDDVALAATYFLSDEAPLVNGTVMELEQFPMIGRMQARSPR